MGRDDFVPKYFASALRIRLKSMLWPGAGEEKGLE